MLYINAMKRTYTFLKAAVVVLSLFTAITFLTTGCGDAGKPPGNDTVVDSANDSTGKFFTISDIHFDPFYDTSLVKKLMQTNVEEWEAVFGSSSVKAYIIPNEDSDFPLMQSAFAAMKKQNAKPDFIIITGDFLAHSFQSNFALYSGTDNSDTLRLFIDKTIQFIAMQLKKQFPGVPVYPVLGNNDDYCGDYMIQPQSRFLSLFADTWAPFLDSIKGENTFAQSVLKGGYYAASLPGAPDHVIIGLNTIFFSPHDTSTCQAPDTAAGNRELNWLREKLSYCSAHNMKVWLTCHIPPGVDVYASTHNESPTAGNCSDHVRTMWKPEYLNTFMAIDSTFRNTITAGFAGHTHMDDFRVLSDGDGVPYSFFHITPAISPLFGNNPGFQLWTYNRDSMTLLDYTTYAFSNETWSQEYTFSSTYGPGPIDAGKLAALDGAIDHDTTTRADYLNYYSVGNPSARPKDWEAYRCGIGSMRAIKFAACFCK